MSEYTESLMKRSEIRVSSVLSKNSKEFGKQFLTDRIAETCWSSDQGCPQWVAVKWDSPVKVNSVHVKFQGGFAGSRDSTVEQWDEVEKKWDTIEPWHLEDGGETQSITLHKQILLTRLRLLFPKSTDFFGRIIIYDLDVFGEIG